MLFYSSSLFPTQDLYSAGFLLFFFNHAALGLQSPEVVEAIFSRLCAYHQSQGVHLVEELQQIFPAFCRLINPLQWVPRGLALWYIGSREGVREHGLIVSHCAGLAMQGVAYKPEAGTRWLLNSQ